VRQSVDGRRCLASEGIKRDAVPGMWIDGYQRAG
jgi:hypothetical protein